MLIMTTKQLASVLGVDYIHTNGLIKILLKNGLIKEEESIRKGVGKPTKQYSFPNSVCLNFETGEIQEVIE